MYDTRRQVLDAAKEMYACGLVVGTAGNVSGRVDDTTVCVTPSSLSYPEMTIDDLVLVDLDGNVVDGHRSPTSEKAMHLECYRRYPEVGGVVHCHPVHASMFAVARQPIPAVIEEVIVFVGGAIPVAGYRMTGSDELAVEAASHLGNRAAVLMANHGLLCVGKSAGDALHQAQVTERCAHIVFGARLLGHVEALPDETVSRFTEIASLVRTHMWKPKPPAAGLRDNLER